MAGKAGAIKQNDAKRLFRAAIDAGFENAIITIHPDGRIQAAASFNDAVGGQRAENTWDDVLK